MLIVNEITNCLLQNFPAIRYKNLHKPTYVDDVILLLSTSHCGLAVLTVHSSIALLKVYHYDGMSMVI